MVQRFTVGFTKQRWLGKYFKAIDIGRVRLGRLLLDAKVQELQEALKKHNFTLPKHKGKHLLKILRNVQIFYL